MGKNNTAHEKLLKDIISNIFITMPFFLFTFRPQVSEQLLFEDFLSIFLPLLEQYSKYSYSIEEDNTLNKHLHVLVEHPTAKDNTAFKQLFNRKIFKDFKQSLKSKQTNDSGFDDRKVNEDPEDHLKVLGYVNKETQCLRRKYKGYTNEEILAGIKFYYASQHIEKSKVTDDWTILTMKNAHVIIEKFVQDNQLDWNEWLCEATIKMKMIESKYSFINFTRQKQSQLFNELIIANTKDKNAWHYKEEKNIHDEDSNSSYVEDQNQKISLMAQQLKELGHPDYQTNKFNHPENNNYS